MPTPADDQTNLRIVAVMEDAASTDLLPELQLAGSEVDAVVEWIPFAQFDYGEARIMNLFYGSDVVVVDMTEPATTIPLMYRMAVRESYGRIASAIIVRNLNPSHVAHVRTYATCPVIVYKVVDRAYLAVDPEPDAAAVPLHEALARILQPMNPQARSQRARYFHSELEEAHKLKDVEARRAMFRRLHAELVKVGRQGRRRRQGPLPPAALPRLMSFSFRPPPSGPAARLRGAHREPGHRLP